MRYTSAVVLFLFCYQTISIIARVPLVDITQSGYRSVHSNYPGGGALKAKVKTDH
jgi:hypothetical protein